MGYYFHLVIFCVCQRKEAYERMSSNWTRQKEYLNNQVSTEPGLSGLISYDDIMIGVFSVWVKGKGGFWIFK